MWILLLLVVTSLICTNGESEYSHKCPELSGLKSVHPTDPVHSQRRIRVVVHSRLPVDALVYWVDFEGNENAPVELPALDTAILHSYKDHRFRVRAFTDDLLVQEFIVQSKGIDFIIDPCGKLVDFKFQLYEEGRDEEFKALTHDQNAACDGPSSQWSCVRKLTEEQFRSRPIDEYGFHADETTPNRVGLQIDSTYVQHICAVPMLDKTGVGFLKMSQTKRMRDILLPFYERAAEFIETHPIIPGNYTNIDIIGQSKIDLDKHQVIRLAVVKEMQQVLQWWTGMRLKHTSTFGIRIYRRGSMLIDHVDRKDTHLASAVIHIGREVDPDGGWPLEVLLGDKTVGEVYLQPGEMVLYEGAWMRHGRPMRFKGESFANLFSHFAPPEYVPAPTYPDKTKPLPQVFYGYNPQRCDTVADVPGASTRCIVTDAMRGNEHRDEL